PGRLLKVTTALVVCIVTLPGVGCARRDTARPERSSILEWAYQAISADFRSSWSNGVNRISVAASGDLEFTADDTDVKSISPGGFLVIEESTWFTTRRFEAAAGPDRSLARYLTDDGRPRDLATAALRWVAQILTDVIRHTAIGAVLRVERINRAHGPAGVLEEISRLQSDHARRVYFEELFRSVPLDSSLLRRAARQIASNI